MAAMEKATGKPAISAASSLTSAFNALGAKKLVFVSETARADHEKKLLYLREAGYDILADRAVGLAGSDQYCTMPPQLWYDAAIELWKPEAQACFISCANIHSIDAIESIEKVLDRPVVTSNQAAFWHALRTIGLNEDVPGLGRLMKIGGAQKR